MQVLYPLVEGAQDQGSSKAKHDLEIEQLLSLVGLESVLLKYSLDGKPTDG